MPFITSTYQILPFSIIKPFYKKQWGFMKTTKHNDASKNNETAEKNNKT